MGWYGDRAYLSWTSGNRFPLGKAAVHQIFKSYLDQKYLFLDGSQFRIYT